MKYKDKFDCDGIVWEFGYWLNKIDQSLVYMKGLLFIEMQQGSF